MQGENRQIPTADSGGTWNRRMVMAKSNVGEEVLYVKQKRSDARIEYRRKGYVEMEKGMTGRIEYGQTGT